MGKTKTSYAGKCKSYEREFGSSIFSTDGKILLCRPCNTPVACEKRSQVTQHLATASHLRAVDRNKGKKQTLLLNQNPGPSKSQFNADLCKAFVSADIPFHKLHNPVFKHFLTKYTNEDVPVESTIRKNYMPELYHSVIEEIQEKLRGKYLWISPDETADSLGRLVVNIVVGSLDDAFGNSEEAQKNTFLLHTTFVESTNHSTIAKAVNDAMQILFPEGIQYDKVLLFVSDAARYMIKASETLSCFYTKMLHLTCLDHGLNRVCEVIRCSFPAVNRLVSSIKKVFIKSPTRRQAFAQKAPNVPLPPEPILTRWGTWITAATYYAENLPVVREIVDSFDRTEALCIAEAQECARMAGIENDLAYIKCNFAFLVDVIHRLEGRMLLVDAMGIVQDTMEKLNGVKGNVGDEAKRKLRLVLDNNKGWSVMENIAQILSGDANGVDLSQQFSADELSSFRYAPITSCDVERSFSRYKSILRSNRLSFQTENLKHFVISHCYMSCNNIV